MTIDNPTDQIRKIISEGGDGLADKLMQVGGIFAPLIKIASIFQNFYSADDARHRVKTVLFSLCDELDRQGADQKRQLESVMDSEGFRDAVNTLLVQATSAASEEKLLLLARAVARGCFPKDQDKHRRDDLGTYIKEIAQLGAEDIRMLKLLRDVFANVIRRLPNLNKDDEFYSELKNLKRRFAEEQIHPDDAVAIGARLAGFGLAFELMRNSGLQSIEEHFFRPTLRGLFVLSLLEDLPVEKDAKTGS